jgi:hypothetical protein
LDDILKTGYPIKYIVESKDKKSYKYFICPICKSMIIFYFKCKMSNLSYIIFFYRPCDPAYYHKYLKPKNELQIMYTKSYGRLSLFSIILCI